MSNMLSVRRDALRRAVVNDTQELRRAVGQLRSVVRQRADVPGHIARRPYPWLGGAFLVGMWLGSRAAN